MAKETRSPCWTANWKKTWVQKPDKWARRLGAGEMTRRLRVLVALTEDKSGSQKPCLAGHNPL